MDRLALTFDDGPDPDWTPRLLELLSEAGAQATFFPIAERAAGRPDLIERMLSEGHAVGLHCGEHVRHTERDAGWLRRDTSAALATLGRWGVDARLWRTPWGQTAPWTAEVAAEHGLELVHWTVDTHDWRGDSANEMFAATQPGLTPGSIVLAHDAVGPGARRADVRETLGYVERVVAFARAQALTLSALVAPVVA